MKKKETPGEIIFAGNFNSRIGRNKQPGCGSIWKGCNKR
jgi:hypothetical protein